MDNQILIRCGAGIARSEVPGGSRRLGAECDVPSGPAAIGVAHRALDGNGYTVGRLHVQREVLASADLGRRVHSGPAPALAQGERPHRFRAVREHVSHFHRGVTRGRVKQRDGLAAAAGRRAVGEVPVLRTCRSPDGRVTIRRQVRRTLGNYGIVGGDLHPEGPAVAYLIIHLYGGVRTCAHRVGPTDPAACVQHIYDLCLRIARSGVVQDNVGVLRT